MSEEPTDRLEGGTPFETRVLRELSNINQRLNVLEGRLTSLEEKVDARLHDTRPIWEAVLSRLDSIDTRLERVDDKFDAVASGLLDMRAEIKTVKKRLPAA